MTCECGADFCYRCGRAYQGGLPCNCGGQNEWVEEDPDENDPRVQQQILNGIRGGQADGEDNNEDDENGADGEEESGREEMEAGDGDGEESEDSSD